MHSLSIKCKAGAIPDSIKIDISNLQVDEGIHVRDLVLPPDVTVNADPDLLLVHVVVRGTQEEPAEAAAEAPYNPRSSNPNARKKRRKTDSCRT